jgi:hypothetical protein
MGRLTEWVRWGNGGEDPAKEGYHRSLIDGMLGTQQFAAFLGINQGTARDLISGRRSGTPLGKQIGNLWFISYVAAVQEAVRRGHISWEEVCDGQAQAP